MPEGENSYLSEEVFECKYVLNISNIRYHTMFIMYVIEYWFIHKRAK